MNLEDPAIFEEKLYPVVWYQKWVIAFFLDTVVFHLEGKLFQQKLVARPWDVCPAGGTPARFSGTDDKRLLLPVTIRQQNMEELMHTVRTLITSACADATRMHRHPPSSSWAQAFQARVTSFANGREH